MDGQTAFAAGKAAAAYFRKSGQSGHIVIGRDTRISGGMLAQAVAAGICSAGVDARHLGVAPTPAVAHAAMRTSAVAGVVVSASHNPFDDNGIKLFDSNGCKLSDQAEDQIEALMKASELDKNSAEATQIGQIVNGDAAGDGYIQFLIDSSSCKSLKDMTIVLDCANGATYRAAPELFQRLGARVTALFCNPDGVNINDRCGSQHPEAMAKTVVSQKADIGLAFDGDGDRLVAVDEKGRVLSGDQIMAVCANDMRQKGSLKNNRVVSTVMSNLGFGKALRSLGIEVVSTRVGDRYVMQAMMEHDAMLGGEDSGHIIFRDRHTTGDGLFAALRLIEAMQSSGKKLSDLSEIMTVYPQELINVDVSRKPELDTIPQIVEAIASVESKLAGQGRVLVRYSGTQLMCRVMVEGPTPSQTRAYARQIAGVVRSVLSNKWESIGIDDPD
jgi:phosphoglucosamine mutase